MDHFKKAESPNNVGFDLNSILATIKEKWWLFLISVVISCSLAFALSRFITPMYQISAKLLVDDAKKGGASIDPGELLGDMGGLLSMKSNVDNEVEVLRTRSMAEKVVKNLNLNIVYYQKRAVGSIQLYEAPFIVNILKQNDSLFQTKFDITELNERQFKLEYEEFPTGLTKNITGNYNQPLYLYQIGSFEIKKHPGKFYLPDTDYKFVINSVDNAVTSLQSDLTISVTNKVVTTVDLVLKHPLPKLGEEILNNLIKGYIDQNSSDKNKVADSTIAFIENRLLLVSQELGDIEGSIQNFKQKNKLADLTEQSKIMVTANNRYENEMSSLETHIDIINDLILSLNSNDKTNRSIPTSAITQDLSFSRLIDNYNSMLLERERLLMTSTENNPYIKNLDERINSLKNTLLSSLSGIKRSTEISLNQIKKKMNSLGNDIRNVPANERTYLGMFRQQTLKQELYLYLLQKREEIALSKTSNLSNSKVIDPPKSSFKPISPNKVIIIIFGMLIGLLIPVGYIYTQELLNDKIQNKEDITKILPVPVIGEIGHTTKEESFVHSTPKSILSEQYRALRTNLSFYTNGNKNLSLLITSSIQAEGKTFTAMNLGSILALSGKKVLIIDLDLRVASLTNQLNLNNKAGFTNYIISESTNYSKFIYPSGLHENLFAMPSGILPPNPAETLMHEKTEQFLSEIRTQYDHIILDAPPIGLVADAQILTKFVDITLYLVRQNYTLKSRLQILLDLFNDNKIGKFGIIFNDIKKDASKPYGYGKYGGNDKKNETNIIMKIFSRNK